MATPIYSPLPATPVTPLKALQIGRSANWKTQRDDYPPLPWVVEELIGTLWRNYPTGSLERLSLLEYNYRGVPVTPFFASTTTIEWKQSPGLWWNNRFVIEHWIRVDHWPPEEQLPWFGVEFANYREHIALFEKKIAYITANWKTVSCPAENRNQARWEVKYYKERLAQAIRRLHAFAEHHHLEVLPDLLNSGLNSTGSPVQLTLL